MCGKWGGKWRDRRALGVTRLPARDTGRESAVFSNDRAVIGLEGFVEETQGDAPEARRY
jgi:hypothetical protein